MTSSFLRGFLAFGLLSTASVHALALSYADVGDGPFGSLSWVTRDYHFNSVTHYDGGPMHFLSGQSDAYHLTYADADMSGDASSSLLDGTLHVASSAGAWGPNAANYTSSYTATAGTAMWDHITIGADEGTHLIPLSMRVDGMVLGAASAKVRYYVGPNDPFSHFANTPFQGWQYLNGNASGTGTRLWDTTFNLGSVWVDAAYSDWPLNVYFEMVVTSWSARTGGGIGDFGHTARFSWDLPDGVTVQSASGQFMTDAALPVPEPASAALLLAGLTLLPAMRRRMQRESL